MFAEVRDSAGAVVSLQARTAAVAGAGSQPWRDDHASCPHTCVRRHKRGLATTEDFRRASGQTQGSAGIAGARGQARALCSVRADRSRACAGRSQPVALGALSRAWTKVSRCASIHLLSRYRLLAREFPVGVGAGHSVSITPCAEMADDTALRLLSGHAGLFYGAQVFHRAHRRTGSSDWSPGRGSRRAR
jgi:hypothetical protein